MREIVLVFVALSASLLIAEDTPAEAKIEATGLRIVAPSILSDETMRPFGMSPGTTISLLISRPSGGFVQFDRNDSTLTKFLDSKGNDLLTKPAATDGILVQSGFSLFPKISRDGKFCTLEVSAPNPPARGCTQLVLEGTLTMLCASKQTESIHKDVIVKNGTKINAGTLELTLDHVGKPDFGSDKEVFGVTLRSNRELDDIADVKFLKADGTEIKSRRTGVAKMGVLGSLTVEWSYNLEEQLDTAKVKLLLWSDLQKKRLPFSLKIDQGL